MRWSIIAFVAALLVAGCSSTPDPIDRLVTELSSTQGMWVNGYWQGVNLPKTATPKQVVEQYFKESYFDTGQVTNYTILKVRQVDIPYSNQHDLRTAVLAQTSFGEKIILLKSYRDDWSCRAYDANRYYGKIDTHDTPLLKAVSEPNIEKVKALLANKADPNTKNDGGWMPLHVAAMSGNKDIVALLLAAKADVNAPNHSGETPLHMAAIFGQLEVIKLLVANHADVNAKDSNGETPLQIAVHEGNEMHVKETVQFLLENKADANTRNHSGETPLLNAAWSGETNLIELLLAYKADVNATNSVGETPLYFAASLNHNEAADLLRQHGGHE
jgi:ankyrin repeat protein